MGSERAGDALLAPYLAVAPGPSLHLVTGVLGASPNWLLERYVAVGLRSGNGDGGFGVGRAADGEGRGGEWGAVVLVSFMRDWTAWREGIRRSCAIDIEKEARAGRFAFVDGLSVSLPTEHAPDTERERVSGSLPQRRTALPDRGGGVGVRGSQHAPTNTSTVKQTNTHGRFALIQPVEQSLGTTIQDAINHIQTHSQHESAPTTNAAPTKRITLILDEPALPLATETISLSALLATISILSTSVHATIVATTADIPLISAATAAMAFTTAGTDDGPSTSDHIGLAMPPGHPPLEERHAGMVLALAHRAARVLQLRRLDTGAARDISGVLRISRGGAWCDVEEENGDGGDYGSGHEKRGGVGRAAEEMEKREVLYLVRADGKVNVFERGSL